ncbi:hydrogenase expression protein [Haloprofundus marisrubri]|uniref:Hydrogenase expression protein n=1 Tax=Haloprofundus marisrubri TaxID=1514971 RepID=A0A0W1RCR3_9EURY|nr:AIR synthase family protein [Haloprofundus marisrubri]KTG11199.1 hydrogenase expression protein [Haloprofundus marisrubri]
MTGKFTPDDLAAYVFSRTGAPNDDLLVGPAFGEDAAAVRVGDETLVLSSDPISLAAERIGTLGVAIVSNDVAACGGIPEWLTCTILLPDEDHELLDSITAQLDAEADRLGITIVGGHTESVSALSRPLLSLTCAGTAHRYVPTGGAEPGDRILLTKAAGVEGTAVLATDFAADLDVPSDLVTDATTFFDDLSVIPDAAALEPFATAMHDPTEGGVAAGLSEMAVASDVVFSVDPEDVPVRPETRRLCDAVGVDPLRILGSGALVATVSENDADDALATLADAGIDAAEIGVVQRPEDTTHEASGLRLGDEFLTSPPEDDMYALWD